MEVRQFKTLVAIADYGSFAAAADAVGLTQSAISLQIKNLEDELGIELFDRRHRPPVLNTKGTLLVEHARTIVTTCDLIARLGAGNVLEGSLVFGAVPTSLGGIVPEALAAMREQHPNLHISVKSGLSLELAGQVRSGEIDAALVTEPTQLTNGVEMTAIAREPLVVIAPPNFDGESDRELLDRAPFIQFNKRTWAGQQIHQHLIDRAIHVKLGMEIDSLEAIARMVRHGLGVSVIPVSQRAPQIASGLKWLPFGEPPLFRNLVLIHRSSHHKDALVKALIQNLTMTAAR